MRGSPRGARGRPAGGYTLLRTLGRMTLSGNSEIQRIIGAALAARPYSHSQRAEPNVTAVITVEDDLRYLPRTFRAVLAQSVLPSTIVIADCSGRTVQSVQTSFEIIPTKEDVLETMPEPQRISIQIVRVAQARSFADAVAKVLRNAQVDTSTKTLWLLHDESRPADERCLERLLDAWANSPTAALLGAKQLDWEGRALHDVGCYAARGRVVSLVVDGEPDQEQYDGRRDVFSVSLAGALVPVNTLAAVHGVNPWFGTFDESEDFCRRLCLSGRRVVVVPGARIAHRRARYDGVRTRDGGAIEPDAAVDSSMAQLVGAQKYAMTDMAAPWWPLLWVVSLAAALVGAVSLLFRKRPYRAMCRLVMPWAALVAVPGALAARHRVAAAGRRPRSQIAPLIADRRQIRQWKARSRAFDDQRSNVILDPLALVHLRHRRIRRWAWALAAALLAFGATAAMYWPILRHAFSDASMLSTRLLPTSATFRQLAEAATTPWVYGVGTGVPAPPSPWLLVLMAASVLTGGHVAAALALVFFLSAPAGVLSFWALAGVVTRSNPIRVASALCWYGLSLAFGLYDTANLPMLTVMTFLPAALALSFKAVGMYRTEDPVNPRSSVQAAAAAALLFIPAVAAEPQLLLALVVIFVAFLVFVRRHRLMLLLIPLPAAFALAPTLVNAVRYAGDGMWRQLFGDVMVPTRPVNGEPEAIGLTTMVWRAFGLEAAPSWPAMLSCADPLRTLIVLCCAVCAVIALLTLLRPGMLRPCRILWTVTLCGLMLAVTSAVVVIAVTPDGAAAGSVLPGVALAACGMLACVAMAAGPGVTPFHRLVTDHTRRFGATTLVQGAVTLFLTAMTAVCLLFGVQTANAGGVAIAGSGLPMVAQDYLAQDPGRRVLALAATNADTVAYTAMRTGRGDLIDSSAAWRVSRAFGHEEHTDDEQLAHIAARLLANSDNDAIRQLSDLGFGGIYVVTDEGRDLSARAGEQLQANVTASQGTQEVVSNAQGTYYRLTLDATAGQHIDTDAQLRMETSPWRTAWLWCLAILVAIYGIIAIPRSHGISKEDQQ